MKDQKVRKKTGIMGGTFNPVHYGHLLMAERALEDFCLDEVCFIPTGLQWMKKGDPDLLAGDVRYEMTCMAIEGHAGFCASRMEIDRKGNTYTFETMQELKTLEPDTDFYYILGADTLMKMEYWMHPEIVFESAVILCAVRKGTFPTLIKSPGGGLDMAAGGVTGIETKDSDGFSAAVERLRDKYGADIRLLSMPRLDISSTEIRSRIRAGKSTRYLLPDTVREYILERKLYCQ